MSDAAYWKAAYEAMVEVVNQKNGEIADLQQPPPDQPMSEALYQFFQNSRHGNPHTLQMMLDRDEWLDLIAQVVSQLKDNADGITIELVGRMISTEDDNE